jgi:hypothetical protein
MKHGKVLISKEAVKFMGWFFTGEKDPSLAALEWAAQRIQEEIGKRKSFLEKGIESSVVPK